jgi:non-canonical (house-cleaning) NTP pyrophosphatase
MKIIIGTRSERKINSVKKVLESLVTHQIFDIESLSTNSNVPETPYDKETYDGALNRALECKEKNPEADYFIGIESGLVERYGHTYEEAWTCVLDKSGKEYFGYSSGLKLPDYIQEKMKEHDLPHYLIFAKLNNHFDKDVNSDTWGQYSGNMLLREISIEESLRNALVQLFAPEDSYYKK